MSTMSSSNLLLVTVSLLVCISISCTLARLLTETLEAGPPLLQETPLDKKEILKEQKIVPKVIAEQPRHVLFGDYDGKEISFGNVFTREEIKKKPHYLDWPINGTKFLYCLLVVGIDAPNKDKPKLKDFRHWLVGNIPGTDIEKGNEILPYVGAGNFYDEGPHRIIFLVFKQPGRRPIKFYERIKKKVQPIYVARGNTSTLMFVKKYGLRQAVAANFLVVEADTPQSTTDYYAHTELTVPPDWQGITLKPDLFGLTFDIPED